MLIYVNKTKLSLKQKKGWTFNIHKDDLFNHTNLVISSHPLRTHWRNYDGYGVFQQPVSMSAFNIVCR